MKVYVLHGHGRPLTCVRYNHSGDLLFTAGKDSRCCVWRTSDGTMIGTYAMGTAVINTVDVSLDSSLMVAASTDCMVLILEVLSGKILHRVELSGPCKFVEWSSWPGSRQKEAFVAAHWSFKEKEAGAIVIYRLNKEKNEFVLDKTFSGYSRRATVVRWGPFDETVVSMHEDGTCNLWDAKTGELLLTKPIHDSEVTDAMMSLDRLLLLTSGRDKVARLMAMPTLDDVAIYETDRPLNTCAISPLFNEKDERRKRLHLLLGGGQAAAEVTTTKGSEGKFEALLTHMVFKETLGTIRGHFGPINTICWAPDGTGFASGGEDGYIRLHKFDKSYFDQSKLP